MILIDLNGEMAMKIKYLIFLVNTLIKSFVSQKITDLFFKNTFSYEIYMD